MKPNNFWADVTGVLANKITAGIQGKQRRRRIYTRTTPTPIRPMAGYLSSLISHCKPCIPPKFSIPCGRRSSRAPISCTLAHATLGTSALARACFKLWLKTGSNAAIPPFATCRPVRFEDQPCLYVMLYYGPIELACFTITVQQYTLRDIHVDTYSSIRS